MLIQYDIRGSVRLVSSQTEICTSRQRAQRRLGTRRRPQRRRWRCFPLAAAGLRLGRLHRPYCLAASCGTQPQQKHGQTNHNCRHAPALHDTLLMCLSITHNISGLRQTNGAQECTAATCNYLFRGTCRRDATASAFARSPSHAHLMLGDASTHILRPFTGRL